MTPSIFWLAALVLFILGEAITVGLTSIWFALGALGALVCAMLGVSIWIQVAVFVALSALCVLLLRPFAQRFLQPGYSPTNADRVIGMTALVTETIDNRKGTGLVSISGQVWTARSQGDEPIPPGTEVRVLSIEGVKVIVAPV